MGWLGALRAGKSAEESFPLQRRLPSMPSECKEGMKIDFMIAGAQAGTTALANYTSTS